MKTTLHVTYPDGETAEARFAGNLESMLDLYSPDWPMCQGCDDPSCPDWAYDHNHHFGGES